MIYFIFLILPIQILARLILQTSVRLLGINSPLILSLATGLFAISTSLVRTVGIVPVFRVVFRMRQLIRDNPRTSPLALINQIQQSGIYNPFVVNQMHSFISALGNGCVNPLPARFGVLYSIILTFLSLGISKNVTLYVFRFFFGLLLSSLGILWDSSLNSISVLHDMANTIVDLTENKFNIKIPKLSSTESVGSTEDIVENVAHASWLAIIGVVLLGVIGTIGALVLVDQYSHETIQNIPVVNTFVDYIYSGWDVVTSWFYGRGGPSAPSAPSVDVLPDTINRTTQPIVEAISRASSGGSSDITITDLRTPRVEVSTLPQVPVDLYPSPAQTPTPEPVENVWI